MDHHIAYIGSEGRTLIDRRGASAPCYGSLWTLGWYPAKPGYHCIHDISDTDFFKYNFSPWDHLEFCERVMEPDVTPTLNGVSSKMLGNNSYSLSRSRFVFTINRPMNANVFMALLQMARTPAYHLGYSAKARAIPYASMLVRVEQELEQVMPRREASFNAAHILLYSISVALSEGIASDSHLITARKPLPILYSVEKYLSALEKGNTKAQNIQKVFSYEPSFESGACLLVDATAFGKQVNAALAGPQSTIDCIHHVTNLVIKSYNNVTLLSVS